MSSKSLPFAPFADKLLIEGIPLHLSASAARELA